jgi:hypothetical protein
MPAAYFLGNRLLAVTTRSPLWDDMRESSRSQMYFCPTCGEVWARIAVEGQSWVAHHIGCAQHPSPVYDVGGSFIPLWRSRLDDLPQEVLEYELAIRLATYPSDK